MDDANRFLRQSREYLTEHYLPKIEAALEGLTEEDIWWRPNPASNSIGNLLLHLAGNIRQWIVSGVGGAADRRARDEEFAATGARSREELLALLRAAVRDADATLARTDPGSLGAARTVQGRDTDVLAVVYHVVEHFAMHTGQILYIAKLRSGRDLGFYRKVDGVVRPAWPGHPTSGSA